MIRRAPLMLAAAIALLPAVVPAPSRAELVLPRISQNAVVKQTLGTTDLTFTYSRPGVKNRAIWGALVPFDKPWRTGANEATTFTTTDEITVSGQKLPAGTYSFFTIPTSGAWTVIFSKQKELWGSTDYDPKDDALRVTATPDTTQAHQEWMYLGFDDLTPTSVNLVLRWQRLKLAVPIAMDVNAKVVADCRREIAAAKPDDWRTLQRAASYCFDNSVAMTEASGWLDKSIAIQKQHSNLALKARWLWKDGKKKDAIATAKQAIEVGKASPDKPDVAPTEKLLSDWVAAK